MRLAESQFTTILSLRLRKFITQRGLQLDGWAALQYTRMRKDDPEGIMAGRDDNDK